MPTPTTIPSSGPIDGVESVSGRTVVKVDDALASSSSGFAAVALRV
jgi:hypothetical protein